MPSDIHQSLIKFRESFLESLLSMLWGQWTALGVPGTERPMNDYPLDPEALLLLTCSIGRHDARLFDEVIDWLILNGRQINLQRLKKITHMEPFSGARVLPAIAGVMALRHRHLKWKGLLAKSHKDLLEPLFLQRDGRSMGSFGEPDPVFKDGGFFRGRFEPRGHATVVPTVPNAGFLFKLRSLFGVSARCEIIFYLLTHEEGTHPSRIARETYYAQKTVQDALVDMMPSGLLRIFNSTQKKDYSLDPQPWLTLLKQIGSPLKWVTWPAVFSALDQIWVKLNEEGMSNASNVRLSSELRTLAQNVRWKMARSGLGIHLSDERSYLGEDYTQVFLADMRRISGKEA